LSRPPRGGRRRYPRRASPIEIRLASLDVGELPVHMAAPGDDWDEILDAHGDMMRLVPPIIEALRDGDSAALLTDALI
jgi:hypothetical protein